MLIRRKLVLFAVALVVAGPAISASASTARNKAPFFSTAPRSGRAFFLARSRGGADAVLDIGRGGAGPLNPVAVEKANAALQLGQAVPLYLSPSTALKLYGTQETPWTVFLMERCFTALLSYAVGIYCVVFQKMAMTSAFAFSSLPWVATSLRAILDGTPTKLGQPLMNEFIVLGLGLLPVATSLSGADCAENVIKGMCIWNMANGAILALLPKWAVRAWGGTLQGDETTNNFYFRALGLFLTGCGIYFYALVTGMGNSMQAMGYSILTHFAFIAWSMFVTKDIDKLGVDRGPYYFWMLEHLCVFLTLALPAAEAATETAATA